MTETLGWIGWGCAGGFAGLAILIGRDLDRCERAGRAVVDACDHCIGLVRRCEQEVRPAAEQAAHMMSAANVTLMTRHDPPEMQA
jgi:hypothetical protein